MTSTFFICFKRSIWVRSVLTTCTCHRSEILPQTHLPEQSPAAPSQPGKHRAPPPDFPLHLRGRYVMNDSKGGGGGVIE